jgi:hypothetical protein
MTGAVDLEKARKEMTIRKAFRNWRSRFEEDFSPETTLSDLSAKTLLILVEGKNDNTFYLLDLVMNVRSLGSGFEFHGLEPKAKMEVMDGYLFLLDRIRFEWMKRLGWLESYPGEKCPLAELALGDEAMVDRLKAQIPTLSSQHPRYSELQTVSGFQKEELIRKLIPEALKEIGGPKCR